MHERTRHISNKDRSRFRRDSETDPLLGPLVPIGNQLINKLPSGFSIYLQSNGHGETLIPAAIRDRAIPSYMHGDSPIIYRSSTPMDEVIDAVKILDKRVGGDVGTEVIIFEES